MARSTDSSVEALLLLDPSGVYARMDDASRALYRARVRRIAASVRRPEAQVARCAVLCARAGLEEPARHVGFYLLDAGERALLGRLHALTPGAQLRLSVRAHVSPAVGRGAWTALFFILFALTRPPIAALVPALIVCAAAARRLPAAPTPAPLPRLRPEALPGRVLVAVHASPRNPEAARAAILRLAAMQRTNDGAAFLLLIDLPDGDAAQSIDDADILRACREGAQANGLLCLSRARAWDEARRRFVCPGHGPGAFEALCRLLRGEESAFTETPPEQLAGGFVYLITLRDGDMLPPGAALRLAGALAHPLVRHPLLRLCTVPSARSVRSNLRAVLDPPNGVRGVAVECVRLIHADSTQDPHSAPPALGVPVLSDGPNELAAYLSGLRAEIGPAAQVALALLGAGLGHAPSLVLALLPALIAPPAGLRTVLARIALLPREALGRLRAFGRGHAARGGAVLSVCCSAGLLLGGAAGVRAFFLALPLGLSWLSAGPLRRWLEAPYRALVPLSTQERAQLTECAGRVFTLTRLEDPPSCPRDAGLCLLACAAARHLGLLEPDGMASRMEKALEQLERLPARRGLPRAPDGACAGSLDMGLLAACLLCCAEAVAQDAPLLDPGFRPLTGRMEALVRRMDFTALYDPVRELFFASASPEGPARGAHVGLLSGQARLLGFVAIATGRVPPRHWLHLNRSVHATPACTLLPALFLRLTPGTLLHERCLQAVSARIASTGSAGGGSVRDAALALCVRPHAATAELARLQAFGHLDAIRAGDAAITLCALCNALTDGTLVRLFHARPEVEGFSTLLEEPITAGRTSASRGSRRWAAVASNR